MTTITTPAVAPQMMRRNVGRWLVWSLFAITLIVAPHDPGFGNWIDTAGHHQGTMLLRWIGATDHPIPESRIIPLDDRP